MIKKGIEIERRRKCWKKLIEKEMYNEGKKERKGLKEREIDG